MHFLALTASAMALIAPATVPPAAGAPPAGAVPAGTYTIADDFAGAPFTVTLTLPEGWTYDPEFSALSGFYGTAPVPSEDHSAYVVPISLKLSNQVPTDNCAWRDSDVTTVTTAAELATALAGQRGSLASTPQPLQIGSTKGVVFTVAPIHATGCDDNHQMVFMDDKKDGWWYHGDGIHDVKTFLALDFKSGLGVVEVGTYAPLVPDDQRQLLAIIDSIQVAEK